MKIFPSCVLLFFTVPSIVLAEQNPKDNKIEIHGHRGSRGTHPENSLNAFKEAIEAGVDVLELDLQLTKESKLVISHDYALKPEHCKMSDGKPLSEPRPIKDLTLQQINQYQCGSIRNEEFPEQALSHGVSLLSFENFLQWFENVDHKFKLNIETKFNHPEPDDNPDAEAFTTEVIRALRAHKLIDRAVLQSFEPSSLLIAKDLEPNLIRSLLVKDDRHFCHNALQINAQIVSPNVKLLTKQEVKYCHSRLIKVIPWTLNSPEQWERARRIGVDGIISDYPRKLIAWTTHPTDKDQQNSGPFQKLLHQASEDMEDEPWLARVFYDRINLSIFLEPKDFKAANQEFYTETDFIVGASLNIGKLGAAVSRSIPHTNGSTSTDGRTKLAAYQFHYDDEQHNAEIYHYTFDGFAVRNNTKNSPKSSGLKDPFYSGITAHSWGVNYTFIKNPEASNFPGRISHYRPEESGYSMLFNAHVSGVNVNSNEPLILDRNKEHFGDKGDVRKIAAFRAYGGPGYGFALEWPNVEINGSIFLDVGYRLTHDSTEKGWADSLGLSLPSRLGARYLEGLFQVGVYGIFDSESTSNRRKINFSWYQSTIQTFIGYDF
jgi:glycerophosphoryl diester phosphodiesterase